MAEASLVVSDRSWGGPLARREANDKQHSLDDRKSSPCFPEGGKQADLRRILKKLGKSAEHAHIGSLPKRRNERGPRREDGPSGVAPGGLVRDSPLT